MFDAEGNKIEVTPARLKHWRDTFAQMKERGVKVPMSWGHGNKLEDFLPIEMGKDRRRRAIPLPENCVGYLHSFEIAEGEDKAELTFDVRRKEDVEKVRHNLADVSPVILSKIKDGDGNLYEDVMTHVDLVQHPVDHRQSDFEEVEVIACSLRYVDSAHEEPETQIFRMQTDAEEATTTPPSDETPAAPDAEAAKVPDAQGNPSKVSDQERLGEVIESLRAMNVVLSNDTTTENFLEHLQQALLTVKAMEGDSMAEESGQEQVTSPNVAMMSAETRALKAHAESQHRKTVAARMSSLVATGRATPAEIEAREDSLKVLKLSLDNAGEHQATALESWILSREEIPAGTMWDAETRTKMSALDEVKHPGYVKDPENMTADEEDEVVEWMFGHRKSPKQREAAAAG